MRKLMTLAVLLMMAVISANATVRVINMDKDSDLRKILGPDTLTVDSIKFTGYIAHKEFEAIGLFTYFKLEYIDLGECSIENNEIPEHGFSPYPWSFRWDEEIGDYTRPTRLRHVILPDNIEKIGECAFCNCIRLAHLNLPKSLKEIGAEAMTGLRLIKHLTLPDGLTVLDISVLANTSLESITFPKSLERILVCALQNSNRLKSIYLPEGLKEIEGSAFTGLFRCGIIVLPSSLEKMENAAIRVDNDTCKVYIKAEVPPTIPSRAIGGNGRLTLYVPVGAKAAYEAAPVWKDFKEIVEVSQFPSAGVEAVVSDGAADVPVYGTEGAAVIEGDGVGYAVYSADGRQAATGIADGKTEIPLPSGLYIVRTGSRATKIAVK